MPRCLMNHRGVGATPSPFCPQKRGVPTPGFPRKNPELCVASSPERACRKRPDRGRGVGGTHPPGFLQPERGQCVSADKRGNGGQARGIKIGVKERRQYKTPTKTGSLLLREYFPVFYPALEFYLGLFGDAMNLIIVAGLLLSDQCRSFWMKYV